MNLSESLALKAVSLLLALILWITILGFKREEMTLRVKFEPLIAPGKTITSTIPSYIQYTLSGPRVLLKDVERKVQPIRPDLRKSQETTIPIGITEENLRDIPAGVRVISYKPTSFVVQLEEIIEKEIPVRPTLRGLPAPGFEIAQVQSSPAKIAVAGPRSKFDELDFIGTEVIDTQDISATKEVTAPVEVDPSKGFRLSREKVVKVKVVVRKSRAAVH